MRKQPLIIIALFFGLQINAQENIFLKRDFWNTKPSIALVDSEIKEGCSSCNIAKHR